MLSRLLPYFAYFIFMLSCSSLLTFPAHADTPIPQHLLWTKTDGSVSVWTLNNTTGQFTSQSFGPYAGWTAKALSDGTDGLLHILWTHAVDGQVSVWNLDSTGKWTSHIYGPFSGWSAVAMSSLASSSFSGTAGGDLFGLFPNPTIALGAVDHTKLASDAISLAQVSGGNLTIDTGSVSINDQKFIGPFTSDIFTYQGKTLGESSIGWFQDANYLAGRAAWLSGYAEIKLFTNKTSRVTIDHNGYVGIGTETPESALDVNGAIHANYDSHFSNGAYTDPAFGTAAGLKVSGGLISDKLTANSLQLTGGSDVAEPYKIAPAADVQPLPGMVVSIDPQQIGQMRVCTHAYDPTVGGIISGAGGVQPGITLRQKGTVADGTLPIACTGRVWCWCDADAGGAIQAGDLLTTSNTPGHAMRVRHHDRAQGAILGKAMSGLEHGKGLVLVLVTLE